MHTYTVSRRIATNDRQHKKRIATLQHLRQGWIPLRPDQTAARLERLHNGDYERHPAGLAEDLLRDPGFFGWACRFLAAQRENTETPVKPFETLSRYTEAERRKLLSVNPEVVSSHRFQQWSRLHLAFAERTAGATSFAEVLCERVPALDRESLMTAILSEELGWHLLVWNYPHVIHSFTRRHLPQQGCEALCRELWGFTPLQLAREFGREWHFTDRVNDSLEAIPPARALPAEELQIRRDLAAASRATGSFAAASCRAFSVPAASSLATSLGRLLEPFGLGAETGLIAEAQDRYAERVATLRTDILSHRPSRPGKLMPSSRRPAPPPTPQPVRPSRGRETAPELLAAIEKIYDLLRADADQQQVLREIVERAAPAAGFTDGCIFLNTPSDPRLIPAVAYTNGEAEARATLRRAISAAQLSSDNPLPLTEQVELSNGHVREMISGAFGGVHHQGVLWLEKEASADADSRSAFNVIRRCLEDCLDRAERVSQSL